jgi:hypothetical protein
VEHFSFPVSFIMADAAILVVTNVIDVFVGRTYQRRPKAAQAGDMDSNTV